MGQALNLHVGELVEVRSVAEILSTLDENGRLDEMPFMPEMLQYCGRQFKVYKRADKTCNTINYAGFGLRRLENTVHLEELRCDGSGHDGCQASCMLFWKEAWLKRPQESKSLGDSQESARCTVEIVWKRANGPSDPTAPDEKTYRCQATDLLKFTTELHWWDLGQYVKDIRYGNTTLLQVLRSFFIWTFNTMQHFRRGAEYPYIAGKQTATPKELLDLKPGDLVQVKSKDEILETLNKQNRNRGLSFDREMVHYCKGTFKVRSRVEKLVNERNGKMIAVPNDCIILEGAICRGDYNKFCPRSVYPYWREIWLRRAK